MWAWDHVDHCRSDVNVFFFFGVVMVVMGGGFDSSLFYFFNFEASQTT